MDDLEFLEGLKTDEEQFNELTAGAEHFIRLKKQTNQTGEEKTASLSEKLKQIGPLAGGLMAGGATAGGLSTYLASKPRAELGGKSRAEEDLEAIVEAQKGRPESGLLHKMRNRTSELEHGYAQAFRDHPVKASLLGAAAGASGGYGLAKLLDALRHGAK